MKKDFLITTLFLFNINDHPSKQQHKKHGVNQKKGVDPYRHDKRESVEESVQIDEQLNRHGNVRLSVEL